MSNPQHVTFMFYAPTYVRCHVGEDGRYHINQVIVDDAAPMDIGDGLELVTTYLDDGTEINPPHNDQELLDKVVADTSETPWPAWKLGF